MESRIELWYNLRVCDLGEMAEWLNAPVLKTGGPQGLGGSNPSLSANSE